MTDRIHTPLTPAEKFEQACVEFFAHLHERLQKIDGLSSYTFEVQATGNASSSTRGVDVTFQFNPRSTYMDGSSPQGASIETVIGEAFRRKGFDEGSKKLRIGYAHLAGTNGHATAADGEPIIL